MPIFTRTPKFSENTNKIYESINHNHKRFVDRCWTLNSMPTQSRLTFSHFHFLYSLPVHLSTSISFFLFISPPPHPQALQLIFSSQIRTKYSYYFQFILFSSSSFCFFVFFNKNSLNYFGISKLVFERTPNKIGLNFFFLTVTRLCSNPLLSVRYH